MIRIFLSNIPSVTNDRRSLVGGCILESRKRGTDYKKYENLSKYLQNPLRYAVRTFENYEAYESIILWKICKNKIGKKRKVMSLWLQKRPEPAGVETFSKSRYRCHQFSTGVSGTSELFSKSSPHIGKYLLSYQQQSV